VKDNELWERLKIHTVPQVRYMGMGTKGLQKMRGDIEDENQGVTIPPQVRWLLIPHTVNKREQRGEI
jgi:hypothetical protein